MVRPELEGWLVWTPMAAQPKTAQRIARAVVAEALEVDDGVRAFAKMTTRRKPKVAAYLRRGSERTHPGVVRVIGS